LLPHRALFFRDGFVAITQGGANAPSLAVCGKGGLAKKTGDSWRKRLDWGIPGEFYYYKFR
jgi:hypothetical protein